MAKRALITGAGGFVGAYLYERLTASGWAVICADLKGARSPYPCVACDIRGRKSVTKLIQEAGPITHLFHLAALSFVPEAMDAPDETIDVNLKGTIYLAQALRAHAPAARFIHIGSAAMYGRPQSLPVTEDHPLHPDNIYAITKTAGEHFCRAHAQATGADVICLRPFNHSGPGQPERFVLPSLAKQVAAIEAGLAPPVLHVGNTAAERDFLHVRDVARAYERVALAGKSGAVYNICSGRAHSIDEALRMLIAMSGAQIEVEVDKTRLRPLDTPRIAGSHEALTRDTGWAPEISFEGLLEDLLDYWRKRVREINTS